jgi:hypothetical protein
MRFHKISGIWEDSWRADHAISQNIRDSGKGTEGR